MAITKGKLEIMVQKLNEKLNRPLEPYTVGTDGRVVKGNQGHIMLDHAAYYGGYTLTEMQESTGVKNIHRGDRLTAKEMYSYLTGLFLGFELKG